MLATDYLTRCITRDGFWKLLQHLMYVVFELSPKCYVQAVGVTYLTVGSTNEMLKKHVREC